jgi:hypothetical protein
MCQRCNYLRHLTLLLLASGNDGEFSMRKTWMAATAAIALGLGTVGAGMTAAMAQMHGGAGGHASGGGGIGGNAGISGGGARIGAGAAPSTAGAARAAGPARAGVTAAPNTFATGRANVQSNAAVRAAPNTAAANPAFAGRNRAFAWRGDRDHDRFRHRRRFAFFPGVGIYDYAGPNCYYDPNRPWTYYNCYPNNSSPSYNWNW